MQTGSSSSRLPKESRVQPPPKETKNIYDRKKCSDKFSKRHKTVLDKVSELNKLTGAPVAVIMFSPSGKLHFFGEPSVEVVYAKYLLGRYSGMRLPMSPKEGVDWAVRDCDSCETKEDCAFLIMKYREAVVRLLEKLEGSENDPSLPQPVHSLSRRNMQTGSSSSRPPRKPSARQSQTPQISVQPLQKEAKKIDDWKSCCTMFSKRQRCIVSKASKLNEGTGAPIAVIMFSPAGNINFVGKPTVEEVFSMYFSRKSHMMPPTSQRERVEECDSRATKEDCAFRMMKYLEDLHFLYKRLENFENNPSVNAGADHEDGVGAGRDPSFVAVTEDGVDCDTFSTSLADSAATSSESWGMDSNPTGSDLEAFEGLLASLTGLFNDNDFQTWLWGLDPEGNENNADDGIFDELPSLGVSLVI